MKTKPEVLKHFCKWFNTSLYKKIHLTLLKSNPSNEMIIDHIGKYVYYYNENVSRLTKINLNDINDLASNFKTNFNA